MKKNIKRIGSFKVGAISAVVAFVLLSLLAGGGLVEVSREIGTAKWLAISAMYIFANKLAAKLMASLAVGALAAFVNSMIAYGASPSRRRRTRATRVNFSAGDGEMSKTA